jgi:hypothetical protein
MGHAAHHTPGDSEKGAAGTDSAAANPGARLRRTGLG